MLAKCFVVHKKIHNVSIRRGDPCSVFFRRKRIFAPIARRETECDVVGETVIFEKERDALRAFWPIQMIGIAPAEYRVPPFSDNARITRSFSPVPDIVAIGELGIAEDARPHAKMVSNRFAVLRHLPLKFGERVEKRERMIIRFPQDFRLARIDHLFKKMQRLRRMPLHLLECGTGKRERYAQLRMLPQKLEEERRRRDV